jgi:hypothetical protein
MCKRIPDQAVGHSGAVQGQELEMGLIVTISIPITVMLHMIHGAAIAFLEAIAEFASITFVDGRMFVYLVIVGIGVTTVHIIAAGSFDTFMEALALRVAIPVGGSIPVAIAVLILILGLRSAILRGARRWRFLSGSRDGCRRGHAESESRN